MPKNIVMIYTDQMHKFALGKVSPFVLTPNLDKLADNGVLFSNAYSNTPVCSPFRANVFSGMYACNTNAITNGCIIPDSVETLADVLNENGYETSFVGKWHMGDSGNKPVPENLRAGFKHFLGYQCYNGFLDDIEFFDEDNVLHEYKGHRTDITTDLGIERLDMLAKTNNPFLHVIFYQAPHYPEEPSLEYENLYKGKNIPIPKNHMVIDPYTPTHSPPSPKQKEKCKNYQKYGNDMQEYLRQYYAMVSQIDAGVGRIIESIEKLGLADDTMIIFSSDHGDMQGSHGMLNKQKPYERSAGIPLIISSPESKKGLISKQVCSSVDYYATALDYAGLSIPEKCDGKSLLDIVETGEDNDEIFAYVEILLSPWNMIREGKYKLVANPKDRKPTMLFDLETDKYELNNLIDNEEYKPVGDKLYKKVMEIFDKGIYKY